MKLILPYLLLLSACPFAYAQTTYYVPDDFSTIQSSIDGASNGDTVIVRDGTYNEMVTLSSRAITLKSENGPASTFISGLGLTGIGVVNCINGEGSDTIIDGFSIIEGSMTYNGGVYLNQSAPKLINLVLKNNKFGLTAVNSSTINISDSVITDNETTGIYCNESTGNVLSCEVTDNQGLDGYAGGLYITYSDLNIADTIISSNKSYWDAGGINAYLSDITISECEISNNNTKLSNGYQGGGIKAEFGSLSIVDSSIEDNTSDGHGGGMHLQDIQDVSIDRCVIQGNSSASGGGGMYCQTRFGIAITNSIFRDNNASYDAGAYIYFRYSTNNEAIVENCLFESNQASNWTGGLRVIDGESNNRLEMDFCTMVNNTPTAMWASTATASFCTNSIFWGNTVSTNFDISYCCVEGGLPGIGNTPYDPLFTAGPQGVYYLGQVQAGQLANSSCLNTGDPSGVLPYGTTRTDEIADAGRPDIGYHYPADPTDTDYDGIPDNVESSVTFTDPNDDDTDDDGLSDGEEHYHPTLNLDPLNFDTDGDLLGDGLEVGMSNVNRLTGTNPAFFLPDSDPSTTTSPVKEDSDGGGVIDSGEDTNMNGMVDGMETDPSAGNGDDDIVIGSIAIAPQSLSMSNGGVAQIMIDFDDKYDNKRYMLLCSTTGDDTGFNLGRIHVPINFGAVLAKTLYSDYYNQMVNFNSDLNINGDALAMIVMPPNSPSSYAGLTLYFAALVIPPNGYPLSVTDSSSMGFTQ